MSIRSINSVLEEKKKKNKPISLLHSYTGLRQVCEVYDFQIKVTAFWVFSNSGQAPKYMRQYGNLYSSSNVFVQVCLNVCIGNHGTVTTQYLQK